MAGINVDRGVEHRFTGTGIAVYMYVDEPGVFYNEHGAEVGPKAAMSAGFPVDMLLQERKKRESILAAGKKIAEGYTMVSREVVETRGDYTIVHIGADRYNVEFSDGSVMNLQGPLSLTVARDVLDELQPVAAADVEAVELKGVEKEKPAEPAKK